MYKLKKDLQKQKQIVSRVASWKGPPRTHWLALLCTRLIEKWGLHAASSLKHYKRVESQTCCLWAPPSLPALKKLLFLYFGILESCSKANFDTLFGTTKCKEEYFHNILCGPHGMACILRELYCIIRI